ncbi:MAG TPA: hypothetical protein VKT77_21940 [Chthonomonadaceae bacterium]|nr:hypothetical protein [Chthonomonadaceae bacterium]
MAKQTGPQGYKRTGTFQEHELKVCDLCSSLNLASNAECFICGWTGHFEQSYDVVRTAMIVATQRYGPLDLEDLTDVHTYREVRSGPLARVQAWLLRLWHLLTG